MAHTTSGYYRDRLGFEPETENRRQYSQQHIAQTKTQYLSSSTAIATTSSRYSASVGNGSAPYEDLATTTYNERQQRSITSGSVAGHADGHGGGHAGGHGGGHGGSLSRGHDRALAPAPGTPGSQGMYEENLTKFKGKPSTRESHLYSRWLILNAINKQSLQSHGPSHFAQHFVIRQLWFAITMV